ncbi:MAG TPA: hypothetical protein VN643_00900 [Pyrinomonadaceae bacterium]|nr:hypothetical protein [Pyrinomonadaceae bacterium]
MNMLRITSLSAALVLLLCLQASIRAQAETWKRVYTGEEFTVEINPASLVFEPDLVRAQFRTILSTPETISNNSRLKYKTRLETIEFKTDGHYRYFEVSLLDSAGKTVQSYPSSSSRDWKVLRGFTTRLFDAARQLPPMGHWTVIGYRYADGKPDDASTPRELAELRGTSVTLDLDATAVGTQRCSAPGYQSLLLTDKEFFLKHGISLDSLGVKATGAEGIVVVCRTNQWTPPQSVILPLPSGHLLMLWKGVFLELKK